MKINNVSRNKSIVTVEVMSSYVLVFLVISVVLFFLYSSSFIVVFVCVSLTLFFLIYILIFWLNKDSFKYSIIFESDCVILKNDNSTIERFNKVSSISITKDEYKGKAIYTTFYNSLGINKIRIISERGKTYFAYRINSRDERRKLINDIELLRKESSYKIMLKNDCQIFK